MDEQAYQRAARRVRALREASSGEEREYWDGYKRGMRRRAHGEGFGTAAEHELWLGMADSPDGLRAARGRGYRDGVEGVAALPADALRLRGMIEAAGMSQREAARELGVSERSMRYYCAGDQPIPRAILLALEHLTECRPT